VREPEGAYGYDTAVAEQLRERILQAFGARVRRIILFGSRARGDALADSDYDVLVVLDELAPAERHATLVRLYGLLIGCGGVAEPWVMSEEEFEETRGVIGGLAYPAAKEGVPLYEAE
jgi:predicted nucleotidyltransferase